MNAKGFNPETISELCKSKKLKFKPINDTLVSIESKRDMWYINVTKTGRVELLHGDSSGLKNAKVFHDQSLPFKSIEHVIGYIKGHENKNPFRRMDRILKLFEEIKK